MSMDSSATTTNAPADLPTSPSSRPAGVKVTAVIVTFESIRTIDATLEAAREAADAGELKVVVVDNASQDGTPEHVRRNYPWVKLVEHGGNFGFARGCNRGFAEVDSPYTLFLNPDAAISRAALSVLEEFLEAHPQCGICAPAIRSKGGVQWAGMLSTPRGMIGEALFGKPSPLQRPITPADRPFETNWVCGAVFMIRSALYRDIGMMDPRFFLYFEETDLCLRVQRQGWQIWAVGKAEAEHVVGASAAQVGGVLHNGCLAKFYYPSRFYYLSKHFGLLLAVLSESIVFAALLGRSLLRFFRGKSERSVRERLAGGFLRMPPPAPE
jgi:GT2 family glycosyltransferase